MISSCPAHGSEGRVQVLNGKTKMALTRPQRRDLAPRPALPMPTS